MPEGKDNENKIKLSEEEEKTIATAKKAVENNKKRKELILERFGPDSKFDESGRSKYDDKDRELYKSIKLPRPEGLTDEMIALIALGDALDPKRLNKPLTSSSSSGNMDNLAFNQLFIIENVIEGDPRTKNFGKILSESKANTVNILEEYQKGNKKPAQEALERSVKSLTSSLGMNRTDSATSSAFKETFRIINEMRNIPDLGVDNMLTEKEKAKLTALELKMKATDKAAEAAAELMEKMPPANSPEREKLVMEYLFNKAVGSEGYNDSIEQSLYEEKTKELHDMLDEYKDFDPRSNGSSKGLLSNAISMDSGSIKHYLSPEDEALGKEIQFAQDTLKGIVLDETLFPAEGVLAADNNADRLRTLSEEEIKKSEYFQQLMNAQTVLEMEQKLKNVPANGFAAYPGVNVPDDDAKRLGGEFNQKKYDDKKNDIENSIDKYMKSVYPQQYADKFGGEIEKPILSEADKDILESAKRDDNLYQLRDNALVKMFGPEGKLTNATGNKFEQKDIDEYSAIKLEKPEGLSDDTIALIALGAAMNPKRLNQDLTGSSMADADRPAFNAEFPLMNILPGDGRTKKFGSVLVDSRKEANEILKAYKEGNPEPAKEALKRVVDVNIKKRVGGKNFRNGSATPENALHRMLQNVKKENPELGLDQYYDEAQNIKEKVNAVQVEYSKKAYEAQQKLYNELPPPNSPERKKLVVDYLFAKEIASAGYENITEHSNKAQADSYKLCEKYGAMFQDDKVTGEDFYQNNIVTEIDNEKKTPETFIIRGKIVSSTEKLELLLRQHELTNVESMIAADGVEKLKTKATKSIEVSEEYLKLVNAKDISSLKKVMDVKSKGNFKDKFSYFISSKDAKKLSFKNELYDKQLAELDKTIDEYAKKTNPEKYAHAFDPKTIVDDAIDLMSSDKKLHIDSKEIKNARSDAKLLKEAMSSSKYENVMDDPKVKEALFTAYKSSIQYKAVKKKDAKIDADDQTWTPKSKMGQDRYKGTSKIEDLARKYIMPEIAKLANADLKAEEAANAKESLKQYGNTELEEGYSITTDPIKKAQEKLKEKSEAKPRRRDSLAEIPVGASEYSDELANIIAANLLGRSYDQLPDDTQFVENYKEKYAEMVEDTKNDIKNRDDFKRMVSELAPKDAVKLALTTDGKGLMMKLAETSKTMLEEEKAAQNASEKQLEGSEKQKGLGIGG